MILQLNVLLEYEWSWYAVKVTNSINSVYICDITLGLAYLQSGVELPKQTYK